MWGAKAPSLLTLGRGGWGERETAPVFCRDSQTSLLCLLGCALVSQEYHEHPCFIAFRDCLEAEEFQAPTVSLLYFTSVRVTTHITEFSHVKVTNSVFSKRALYQSAVEGGTTAWL